MDELIKNLTVEVTLRVNECPCGSKKAPEKCCGPVKPRNHVLELDPRNYYESDGFAIGLDYSMCRIVGGKRVPLIGEPIFSHTYARTKNNKVLVQGKSFGDHVLHPDSILSSYDHLFFVDTNTRYIEGTDVNVTASIHAYVTNEKEGKVIRYAPLALLEFWGVNVPPERLGWHAVLTAIEANNELVGARNALIVDSEMSLLASFNERKMPILNDYYLPEKFELKYASADIGASIANKFIKACDRWSSEKLDDIVRNPRIESLKMTSYPCQWFRQWIE